MPALDRTAPLRFLATAFQADDWIAVLLKSYDSGRTMQRVGPVSMVADSRFQAWLRFQNAQRFNVYLSVNAILPGRRSRTRDVIGAIRHVFLEADRDGPHVLAAVAARPDLPPPSYVLHSSPNRVHILWRVQGFAVEQVEALQKQLACEVHTDPAATSASQMTRLPGFFNHKYAPPSLITIEYRAPGHVYAPSDFPRPTAVATWVPTPAHPRRHGTMTVLERARRYLDAVPPAVAGHHGDLHTFRVCCRLVRGFGLDDADALALLAGWNARCQPPWSELELLAKIQRARRYGREPIGGLQRAMCSSLQKPTR